MKKTTKGATDKKTAREIINGSRKEIVDEIISMLEAGDMSWEEKWFTRRPFNPVSKSIYKGGNFLRLSMAASQRGYNDPRWVTMVQVIAKNKTIEDPAKHWRVKKGSKAVMCEKWVVKNEKKHLLDQNGKWAKDANGNYLYDPNATEPVFIPTYFNVFNASCIEGIEPYVEIASSNTDAKYLFENSPVKIADGNKPSYSLSNDTIFLPHFQRDDDKYFSFYNMLVRATQHDTRIGRKTESQAYESFVDELGAMFLAADTMLPVAKDNNVEYLHEWADILKNDYNKLFTMCRLADDAVGWIQDVTGLEECV